MLQLNKTSQNVYTLLIALRVDYLTSFYCEVKMANLLMNHQICDCSVWVLVKMFYYYLNGKVYQDVGHMMAR